MTCFQSGRINPQPHLTIHRDHSTLMRIDADRSPGQYAAQIAMEQAIIQAQQSGMAMVGVTNSNHFGMAGYYARMAAAAADNPTATVWFQGGCLARGRSTSGVIGARFRTGDRAPGPDITALEVLLLSA